MIRIENWSVKGKSRDPYQSPEHGPNLHLEGEVYGHPNHPEGHKVLTSAVLHADGRQVMTLYNNYVLGKVNPKYKEWYEKNEGKLFNENNIFNT